MPTSIHGDAVIKNIHNFIIYIPQTVEGEQTGPYVDFHMV